MKTLITGGKGFLGSSLAHELLKRGDEVTILDLLEGGNNANVADIEDDVCWEYGDIRNRRIVELAVRNQDVIFHLAGQVSHIVSQQDPFLDLDVNLNGVLNVLESCVKVNPDTHLIFASSRSVYGFPEYLPVDEKHPTNPIDAYGVTKLASEKYVNLYHYHHNLKTTILRMANLFGPRQQLHTRVYQMISWVFRRVLLKEPLGFYGDGSQTRDFLYVDDAVRAYLLATSEPDKANGEVFNLGGKTYCTWAEAFETAERVTGNKAHVVYEEYPPLRKKLENPHHQLDYTKIKHALGWEPTTTLEEGMHAMKAYYTPEVVQKYLQG